MMPGDSRRYAPATARNRGPILDVLRSILPSSGTVLEVASGTGEHVVHFARALPMLEWQPSDPSGEARRSINAWIAAEELENVRSPLNVDASSDSWPIYHAAAIVCINMIHISPWTSTEGLMRGARRILEAGAPFYLYGPFRRASRPIEPSNVAFDEDLRSRNPRWGLRELDDVAACAGSHGFVLDRVVEMPANNLSVIFRRS
jgi:hypothetical protein